MEKSREHEFKLLQLMLSQRPNGNYDSFQTIQPYLWVYPLGIPGITQTGMGVLHQALQVNFECQMHLMGMFHQPQ